MQVATALTVYGIETMDRPHTTLQQRLQQHLPFTVLKPDHSLQIYQRTIQVATALTVYGIETTLIIT